MLDIGDISGKRFMASGRCIPNDQDLLTCINRLWPEYAPGIDEVFGFLPEPLRLYGGRAPAIDDGLSNRQLACLRDHGMIFSLNLTNHYFDDEAYTEALPTLRRIHYEGTNIVCANNTLAERVKNDFPKIKVKASVLRNVNTKAKIEKALELYDSVVLPMPLSDDEEFLRSLDHKDRIVPWATCWCGYYCHQWTCWIVASRKWMGFGEPFQPAALKRSCQKFQAGTSPLAFRLDAPKFAGYTRFKLGQPSNLVRHVQ